MKLSRLQKYILHSTHGTRVKYKRIQFFRFYDKQKKPPKKIDQQGIITRSIDRLIAKGLMIGYGRRTPEKWFIDEVKLTSQGRAEAKKLHGRQQSLPLGLKNIRK